MSEDHLSNRQIRALERAMPRVVMTQFPNPERKGCPGATRFCERSPPSGSPCAILLLTTSRGAPHAFEN